jgi:hypothetical protein
MASQQLPEELLQQIMWYLKLDVYNDNLADDNLTTRMTLLSCMIANSVLHRLAEPVLYHSINQHELTRLVQCFTRRPRLAGLVRELRDREGESHKRLTEKLPDIQAWTEENFELCRGWGRPYEIPTIGLVSLMCTRLETFILERNDADLTFPCGDFFAECTEWYHEPQTGFGTPLGTLRTFIMQPGPRYQDHMSEFDDSWLPGLISLPKIEKIELAELKMYDFEVPDSTSSLQSLTIGSSTVDGLGYTGQLALSIVLERLLVKCPMLKYLDLTFHSDPDEGDDHWNLLGYMLSNHGLSLRTLHLYNPYKVVMPAYDGAPINLAAMTNLRTLTLPGNAILPSRWTRSSISASHPERQSDSVDRGSISSLINDNSQDGDDNPGNRNGLDKGFDPASVSLTDVLPPNLTQLTIVDNTTLSSNVARLDVELQKIMLSSRFERLEVVRLRRDQARAEHMMGPDWEMHRQDNYWKVSRRLEAHS